MTENDPLTGVSSPGWGGWSYLPGLYTLRYPNGYEIDLTRFTKPAEALDWICQIAGKTWATDEVLAGLVRAINVMVEPQAVLCPWGQAQQLSGDELQELLDANYRFLAGSPFAVFQESA